MQGVQQLVTGALGAKQTIVTSIIEEIPTKDHCQPLRLLHSFLGQLEVPPDRLSPGRRCCGQVCRKGTLGWAPTLTNRNSDFF